MVNRPPFGNAYFIDTPQLDELSNRIYTEERQRERDRQQQNRMMDDEFARNLSGIRDSDIGDLTKAYGDYKIAYQNSMRKRNGVSPEEQLEVLRKKAAIYDVLNQSKQEKQWEDMQAKGIQNDKKGIYADNAHELLINRRRTPISKLNRELDQKLLYPYSVPDLTKELATARGQKRKVEIPLGQSKTDPLKDEFEVYEAGNTPNQFYNSLLNDVVAKNQGRNFSALMNNKYDEQQLENLKNRYYAKINDPKFIAVYGKPEPLPESSNQTDLGRAVAIQTMEEIANLPEPTGKKISVANQSRSMEARQKFAMEQQARAQKNSLSRLYVYANIQDRKPETIGRNIILP